MDVEGTMDCPKCGAPLMHKVNEAHKSEWSCPSCGVQVMEREIKLADDSSLQEVVRPMAEQLRS